MASAPPFARERFWIALALGMLALLCWAWLVPAALDMQGDMRGLAAWMMDARWDLRYAALIFGMWAVMMTGMMLPTALPTLLIFAGVARSDTRLRTPLWRVSAFAAGYLIVWCGFSLLATAAQWELARSALLTPMMRLHSPALGAGLLILAGIYQCTPLKRRCLSRCQSPAAFIATRWRPGTLGALRLGLLHGRDCLGCCWALMLLLFVGGVMNLTWIVAITLAVLLEKTAPFGAQAQRLSGALLIGAGLATLAASAAS